MPGMLAHAVAHLLDGDQDRRQLDRHDAVPRGRPRSRRSASSSACASSCPASGSTRRPGWLPASRRAACQQAPIRPDRDQASSRAVHQRNRSMQHGGQRQRRRVDRLLHAGELQRHRPGAADTTARMAGSRRSARSMISSLPAVDAPRRSGAAGPCRCGSRSATPRRSTSRHDRADGPMRVSALTAGSPIATLSASVAPSPWPTMAARRRSSVPCERMAASMSRASSMLVNRLHRLPRPVGRAAAARVAAQQATPRAASASARRASRPGCGSGVGANQPRARCGPSHRRGPRQPGGQQQTFGYRPASSGGGSSGRVSVPASVASPAWTAGSSERLTRPA